MQFTWGLDAGAVALLAQEPLAAPWAAALSAFADRLLGKPAAEAEVLVGSKYFWTSDFYAHHRPRWGAGLKMHGNNTGWTTVGGECDNFEDILAKHSGDGVLNIFANAEPTAVSSAYYEIFPLLDWNKLNGITAELNTPIIPCGTESWRGIYYTTYVGGLSDGELGLAAMDTRSDNTSALRSFFFLADAVVALASNLTNEAGGPVAEAREVGTTLISRLLPQLPQPLSSLTLALANGTTVPSLPDGSWSFGAGEVAWAAAGGLGLLPALPAAGLGAAAAVPLALTVGTASGAWDRIGPFHGSGNGNASGRMLTAWLQHGSDLPASARQSSGYAYALLPNASAADMPGRAAAQGGSACLEASATVHGVAVEGQALLAVFWAAEGGRYACSTAGGWQLSLASSGQGMAMARLLPGGRVQLTAAHPTALGGQLQLTLSLAAGGSACCRPGAAANSTVATLSLPTEADLRGSSVSCECTLL
jgi:hypothetical protein